MESERFKRGWDKLREIDREQGERVVASLRLISPPILLNSPLVMCTAGQVSI